MLKEHTDAERAYIISLVDKVHHQIAFCPTLFEIERLYRKYIVIEHDGKVLSTIVNIVVFDMKRSVENNFDITRVKDPSDVCVILSHAAQSKAQLHTLICTYKARYSQLHIHDYPNMRPGQKYAIKMAHRLGVTLYNKPKNLYRCKTYARDVNLEDMCQD